MAFKVLPKDYIRQSNRCPSSLLCRCHNTAAGTTVMAVIACYKSGVKYSISGNKPEHKLFIIMRKIFGSQVLLPLNVHKTYI